MPHAAGLSYELHGREDAPWLVLSSGLGGAGGYWRPNLPALATSFRVLAYDQRGTGRSGGTPANDLSMADMAGDLAALLDALDVGRASLIGHALGAHIGLALALQAPGRLERIVAVNAWPRLDPMTDRCFDVRLELLRRSGPAAFLLAQPLFLYPATWISEHDAELRTEAQAQLATFHRFAVEARVAALRAFDPSDRLGGIDIPVLALAARDDLLVPWTASRRLAQALPRGEVQTLPWGGHACNVTDPEGFDRIVRPWLAGAST